MECFHPNLPQARSDRDGEVEQGQHPRSHLADEQVGDDRGRYRAVGRLANADQRPERDEPPEMVHVRAEQGGRAPERHAQHHDPFARVPIAQIAEQRCEHHVGQHERGLQEATLVIADLKVVLYLCQYTWKGSGKKGTR